MDAWRGMTPAGLLTAALLGFGKYFASIGGVKMVRVAISLRCGEDVECSS